MLILPAMLSMIPADVPPEWPALVGRKEFNCLAKTIAKLPTDQTIYVDISKCPTAYIQNSYPWVPTESDRNKPRKILRLEPAQSACLRNNRGSLGKITKPIGKNSYLINLAACRKP